MIQFLISAAFYGIALILMQDAGIESYWMRVGILVLILIGAAVQDS